MHCAHTYMDTCVCVYVIDGLTQFPIRNEHISCEPMSKWLMNTLCSLSLSLSPLSSLNHESNAFLSNTSFENSSELVSMSAYAACHIAKIGN